MSRLLLLGFLLLGLAGLVVADNQDGNSQGQNNQGGDPVNMPEPSQAVGAIALLGGTALIVRTRLKN